VIVALRLRIEVHQLQTCYFVSRAWLLRFYSARVFLLPLAADAWQRTVAFVMPAKLVPVFRAAFKRFGH
jgi:hypothetical protein